MLSYCNFVNGSIYMAYLLKVFLAGSFLMIFMFPAHSLIAMDQYHQHVFPMCQLADSTGRSWPCYLYSNTQEKQFFVVKPFSHAPSSLHMQGLHCTGHQDNPLYELFNVYIPTLVTFAEYAKQRNMHALAWYFLRYSRFLEAYQDVTCSRMAYFDNNDGQKIDSLMTLLKLYPKLTMSVSPSMPLSSAYAHAVTMLIGLAEQQNVRAQYYLASLYASAEETNKEKKLAAQYWLHRLFDKKNDCECRDIMLTFDMHPLLSLGITNDDAYMYRLSQAFLYERGSLEEKAIAFEYFKRLARSGDVLAQCYCTHGLLVGLQQEVSYVDIRKNLDQLMSNPAGRQMLPIFAQLCDQPIVMMLEQETKKNDKDARAIFGLIAYFKHYYKQACISLQRSADRESCPYLFFCLANLYKEGKGVERDYNNAVVFYVKTLMAGADSELKNEVEQALHEMAQAGHVKAHCELLLMLLHDTEKSTSVYQIINSCRAKEQSVFSQYLNYLLNKKRYRRIMDAASKGSISAHYLLGVLYCALSDEMQDPIKKKDALEQALSWFEQIPPAVHNVRTNIGRICMWLSMFNGLEDEKKAIFYMQKAVDVHYPGAASKLIIMRMYSYHVTKEDFFAGLEELLKEGEKGDVDIFRDIAEILCFGGKTKQGVVIEKDPTKAYQLAIKLLSQIPDEMVGQYILGTLLYEYGGTHGIPQDENQAQEYLMRAIMQGHKGLNLDYSHIAMTSFKKQDYKKALEWLSKVSDDPLLKLFQGFIHLLYPGDGSSDGLALQCFENSLWHMPDQYQSYHDVELLIPVPTLVDQVTRRAQSGDPRFIVIFLRLALLYGCEHLGIDKSTIDKYLAIIATHDVPTVDSFCAHLYRNGIWVGKSEEKALSLCQKVLNNKLSPAYVYDEAMYELLELLKASNNRIAIIAHYIAVVQLLGRTENERALAVKLFGEAEMLVREYPTDQELRGFARQSGAWDAVLSLAYQDVEVAAQMGSIYVGRLVYHAGDSALLNDIEQIGMPLLEKARGKSPTTEDAFICNAYIALSDAWLRLGADTKKCEGLLERARRIDPENIAIHHRLAAFYRQDGLKGGSPKKNSQKSFRLLEMAARSKNPVALLDLALAYLPGSDSLYVKQGIIEYSEKKAYEYIMQILGENPLVTISAINKDHQFFKVQLLALILLAKIHLSRDLVYVGQLIPHIERLFQLFQTDTLPGREQDPFDRRVLKEWNSFRAFWSIKQGRWADALRFMQALDAIEGKSVGSSIQQAGCHIEQSRLVATQELKQKCYHDAMVSLVDVLNQGAIIQGVFVDPEVGVIFAHILAAFKEVSGNDPYVQTILKIIAASLNKVGYTI